MVQNKSYILKYEQLSVDTDVENELFELVRLRF